MSSIAPRTFHARNGRGFVVRAAQVEDTAPFMALNQVVAREAKYLLTQSDEFPQDIEEQKRWIHSHLDAPGQIVLLAESGGCLVGSLAFDNGLRRRNAHQGMFGMLVRGDWQRIGVGTALLQCLLDWAEANPLIEKVGLAVFSENVPAIGLYHKFGFVEEGRQHRYVKLGPEEYQDAILMYRYVNGPP